MNKGNKSNKIGGAIQAVVAEWLRRWTWNPMGSPRVGSNPAGSVLFKIYFREYVEVVSCGNQILAGTINQLKHTQSLQF